MLMALSPQCPHFKLCFSNIQPLRWKERITSSTNFKKKAPIPRVHALANDNSHSEFETPMISEVASERNEILFIANNTINTIEKTNSIIQQNEIQQSEILLNDAPNSINFNSTNFDDIFESKPTSSLNLNIKSNKNEVFDFEFDSDEDLNRRIKLRNGKEIFEERAYLVGIESKFGSKSNSNNRKNVFSIKDSLEELSQLADTAGLLVVGSTYQKLDNPNPKTYIGMGKVAELKSAIESFRIETIIFDDELSPGQLRSLEKEFGENVRVCDRTALILDIFDQRAATKEASLQVRLAQMEYQLPRLTRMWSHLERQAGGLVKGMGEKQIEVDKRLLRTRITSLKKELECVRDHRHQYRERRSATPIPVISLVGYTNAGKSTLMNSLTNSSVLSENKLFATLDPVTRRFQLPNGKECLLTDTVGFIQKLPTQLVAAFRATLEEISESSLLIHMVDASHPMAEKQIESVKQILSDLDVDHIPVLNVWNKIDNFSDSEQIKSKAAAKSNTICISALSGEGLDDLFSEIEELLKDMLVSIEALIPYDKGEILNSIYKLGVVNYEEHLANGTLVNAHVPLSLSRQLFPYRKYKSDFFMDE